MKYLKNKKALIDPVTLILIIIAIIILLLWLKEKGYIQRVIK